MRLRELKREKELEVCVYVYTAMLARLTTSFSLSAQCGIYSTKPTRPQESIVAGGSANYRPI